MDRKIMFFEVERWVRIRLNESWGSVCIGRKIGGVIVLIGSRRRCLERKFFGNIWRGYVCSSGVGRDEVEVKNM